MIFVQITFWVFAGISLYFLAGVIVTTFYFFIQEKKWNPFEGAIKIEDGPDFVLGGFAWSILLLTGLSVIILRTLAKVFSKWLELLRKVKR